MNPQKFSTKFAPYFGKGVLALFKDKKRILNVINMSYDGGQPLEGVKHAYASIEVELEKKLKLSNTYAGTVFSEIKPVNLQRPDMYLQLMEIPNHHHKLIIGGDHSISIASGAAFLTKYENPGYLVIDAHGDMNTTFTSPSGNVHGMPFAKLIGLDRYEWMQNIPRLHPKNIVYIGTRDLDDDESVIMDRLGIKRWTSEDVNKSTFSKILMEAFQYLDHCTDICVSFDVDSLDPTHISGTGTKVKQGLEINDVLNGMHHIYNHSKVKQFELTEFNPELCREDTYDKEIDTVVDLIISAVAHDVTFKTNFIQSLL